MRSSCLARLDFEGKYFRNWTLKELRKALRHSCVAITRKCPKCKIVNFYFRQYSRLNRSIRIKSVIDESEQKVKSFNFQIEKCTLWLTDHLQDLYNFAQQFYDDVLDLQQMGLVKLSELLWSLEALQKIKFFIFRFDEESCRLFLCRCSLANCRTRLQTETEEALKALEDVIVLARESLWGEHHLVQLHKVVNLLVDTPLTVCESFQ